MVETDTDDEDDNENRVVTKGNAILAYEEIFAMWKVDLNLEQEQKVKKVYFAQAW